MSCSIVSASPAQAARIFRAVHEFDASQAVESVVAPTLVLHARDDARVAFEEGLAIASAISGARFQLLQTRLVTLNGVDDSHNLARAIDIECVSDEVISTRRRVERLIVVRSNLRPLLSVRQSDIDPSARVADHWRIVRAACAHVTNLGKAVVRQRRKASGPWPESHAVAGLPAESPP